MARKSKQPREQFVMLLHQTTDCPAWLALSVYAKALYPVLRRRAGYAGISNGTMSCSVREAADYLGVSNATATRAFWELQRKGFIVAMQVGRLGVTGEGKATTWRLTELGWSGDPRPSKEFLKWTPGNDFPVAKGVANRRRKAA